jgi:hypothetical protein
MSSSTSTIITVVGSVLDGLSHRWKFDETSGTVAHDSAGSCSGVLVGFGATSPWGAGNNGAGLNFAGTNSYVNLDSSQINLTNNFAISTWIYPRDAASGGLLGTVNFQYQKTGFWFWIGGNAIVIGGQTPTGWKANTFALGQIQNNAWYHLVLVYDKSTWRVYLNGDPTTIAYGGNPFWGSDLIMDRTAGSSIAGHYPQYLNGILDDVMIFSRTLSAAEVLALYQANANPVRPDAPANLTASAVSSSEIELTWEHDSADTAGYIVKRSTSPVGPWSIIATVGASANTFWDTGLAPSCTYYYKMRAVNYDPQLKSVKSNEASATTLP